MTTGWGCHPVLITKSNWKPDEAHPVLVPEIGEFLRSPSIMSQILNNYSNQQLNLLIANKWQKLLTWTINWRFWTMEESGRKRCEPDAWTIWTGWGAAASIRSSWLIQKAQVQRHSCGDTKFSSGGRMDLGFTMRKCDPDRGIRVEGNFVLSISLVEGKGGI